MIRLLLLACTLHAKILFQDLPRQKICENGLSWAREFAVAKDCSETVRIGKIIGVSREFKGEPRLWLDTTLLGPLRLEFKNGGWESPEPVGFSAGKHSLNIECGAEAFEIEGVVVGSCSAAEAVYSGVSAAKAASPGRTAVPAPTATPSACGHLFTNSQWLPGRPAKAIMLSVVNGRKVRTPLLTVLKRGEKLCWWFYVHPRLSREALRYPPILLQLLEDRDGSSVLAFSIDHDEMLKVLNRKKKDYEPLPLGYNEDKWSSLELMFCPDGHLDLSLNNGELRGEFSVSGAEMPLKIQTTEIEFEIKGEK